MSRSKPINRAVTRWKGREFVAEYLRQLRIAQEEAAEERPSLDTLERNWRQDAHSAGFSPNDIEESLIWFRDAVVKAELSSARETPPESVRRVLEYNALYIVGYAREHAPDLLKDIGLAYHPPGVDVEDDWRHSAQEAGLSHQEIEESWVWFRRHAFEAPPVLEEAEQRVARETMPRSVRRVLTRDPLFWFVGQDRDLLDDLGIEDEVQLEAEADEWRFWDNIGHAFTDPPDAAARQAFDRLARLVRLKPEHVQDLAHQNGTSMEAMKRHLIQQAVLLSLGAAEKQIRIGQRKAKDDPGHPITLEDVFGREGLQEILSQEVLNNLAETNQEPTADVRDKLRRSLSGQFRPAGVTDRVIYRNWLTKEIRRRTVELLGQDLDIAEAGRRGGSRRREISYNETEPLADVAEGELAAPTKAQSDYWNTRAAGEREDRERTSFRTTDYYGRRLKAWEKKDRLEGALVHRIDWHLNLDRVWREHAAPGLRRYIDCVREELLLLDDNVAAASKLGWTEAKVRDVKRRLKAHIAQNAAQQRWKSQFPNDL